MKADNGLARSGGVIADAPTQDPSQGSPAAVPHVRPLGGRRISFLAWSLAGVAGIGIWALIIRLI